MSNFGIKVNLAKLNNVFLRNFQGKESMKRCIVIPIEDNWLFESEKGGIYLSLSAFEYKEKKYTDTHMLKVSIEKDVYDAMSEEDRNNQPIVGGMHPVIAKAFKTEITTTVQLSKEETDDLPF
jgi:hypothetical protein